MLAGVKEQPDLEEGDSSKITEKKMLHLRPDLDFCWYIFKPYDVADVVASIYACACAPRVWIFHFLSHSPTSVTIALSVQESADICESLY